MAGGRGTRLRPYTSLIPKPLVPLGDKAIIELLLYRLKKSGVTQVTICVNHLANLLKAYLENSNKWGIKIDYSHEDKSLGTIGPLTLIKSLPQNFLVMNGDLLTDLNFRQFFNYHLRYQASLTVATYVRKIKSDFGEIEIDKKENVAIGFEEKPDQAFNVSMGIYALNKRTLDFIPHNQPFGFDHLMDTLLKKKEKIKIYPYQGYWLDIGRPQDYDQANEDIKTPKLKRVFGLS